MRSTAFARLTCLWVSLSGASYAHECFNVLSAPRPDGTTNDGPRRPPRSGEPLGKPTVNPHRHASLADRTLIDLTSSVFLEDEYADHRKEKCTGTISSTLSSGALYGAGKGWARSTTSNASMSNSLCPDFWRMDLCNSMPWQFMAICT